VLNERREAMTSVFEAEGGGIEQEADDVAWWRFAGGCINLTLRYALQDSLPDCAITADNFCIRVRGGEKRRFTAALVQDQRAEALGG
jgi:hypothetical protein